MEMTDMATNQEDTRTDTPGTSGNRPILDGIKIVEFAHVIAGPMAGSLLGDLGAEVIHVEDPHIGDPGRTMGPMKEGQGLWWKVSGRNKRSVTIDLRHEAGQGLARRLVMWADVVISNVRFDTLAKWGLDWESLHALSPRLIYLQVSGNGATSTLRNEPGFGKVGEAKSGVVYITGFTDGPPIHTGFSHADSVTALMGAFAISAALTRRHEPDFEGEWIDLALFESLFRLIEWQVIVFDQLGMVPRRAGNQLSVAPGAVVNTYLSADEDWVTVTSGTPKSVRNIAAMLGEPIEEYQDAEDQKAKTSHLDSLLKTWFAQRNAEDGLAEMRKCEVVGSRIFNIGDIFADDTYRERQDIIAIEDDVLGTIKMQGVVPKLTNYPGRVWRSGPALGADNEYVYRELLSLSAEEVADLKASGTI
jgi:formyl-CoA transferase